MRIRYTKVIEQVVEREVPDYFGHDLTERGRVADILLRLAMHHPETIRDNLYSTDSRKVEEALIALEEAYKQTDVIIHVLGGQLPKA